jgi:hypothetical protein
MITNYTLAYIALSTGDYNISPQLRVCCDCNDMCGAILNRNAREDCRDKKRCCCEVGGEANRVGGAALKQAAEDACNGNNRPTDFTSWICKDPSVALHKYGIKCPGFNPSTDDEATIQANEDRDLAQDLLNTQKQQNSPIMMYIIAGIIVMVLLVVLFKN